MEIIETPEQERLKCDTHVSFEITCEEQLSQFLQCFFLSLKTCGILQCYELLIGRIASSGINPNGADSLKGRLSFKLRNLITTWIKSHQSNSFTNYDRQGLQIFAKRGECLMGGPDANRERPYSNIISGPGIAVTKVVGGLKSSKMALACRNQLLVWR